MGLLFVDFDAQIITRLRTVLANHGGADVKVGVKTSTTATRQVTVRANGYGDSNTIDRALVAVNCWASTQADAVDLTNLVRACLTSAEFTNDGIFTHSSVNAGPNVIDDDTGKGRTYTTFDIRRRGTNF